MRASAAVTESEKRHDALAGMRYDLLHAALHYAIPHHAIRPARQHRPQGLPHLPRLHELRHPRVARLGARRGGEPAVLPARAGDGDQLLRHRRHVLATAPARRSPAGPSATSPRRDEVVIATKVYFPMGDGAERPRAVAQAHPRTPSTPPCGGWGSTTSTSTRSTASTRRPRSRRRWRRWTTWSSAGKARYIGASSMYAWQFAKALYLADRHGWTRFVSMQNHYNLVYREEEREMLPLCREEGIGVIPWSPLARGFLAGNRRRGEPGGDGARQERRLRPRAVLPARGLRRGRARRRPSPPGAASRRRRSPSPGSSTSPA